RLDGKDRSAREALDKTEAELEKLRSRSDELNQARASLQSLKLDRRQKALRDLEERYRKIGGPLYGKRASLERALADAEKMLQDGHEELRNLASGAMPLLLVQDLLESADSRDREEQDIRSARILADAVKKRDGDLLKFLKRKCKDQSVIKA